MRLEWKRDSKTEEKVSQDGGKLCDKRETRETISEGKG